MRFEEIQEKTKNAVFLGFGHTILPSKKGEQTDVFYLFFKEKNTFFEIVFVSDWIKKKSHYLELPIKTLIMIPFIFSVKRIPSMIFPLKMWMSFKWQILIK